MIDLDLPVPVRAALTLTALLVLSVATSAHSQATTGPYGQNMVPQVGAPDSTETLFSTAHTAYRRGDYTTAEVVLGNLADQGNAQAQAELAGLYANGQGVAQDYAEAIRLYRAAADHGNASAQAGLGYMYASGKGVPLDNVQAASWYRKAADNGNAYASRNLSDLLARFPALANVSGTEDGSGTIAMAPGDSGAPSADTPATASDSSVAQSAASAAATLDSGGVQTDASSASSAPDGQTSAADAAQAADQSGANGKGSGGGVLGVIALIVVVGFVLSRMGMGRRKSVAKPRRSPPVAPVYRQQASTVTRQSSTPQSSKSTFVWHPPGASVTIAGHVVPDGMIYVGKTAAYGGGGSGCIVDPALAITSVSATGIGDALGYWPSYQNISPSCRGAYLRWLASGKRAPGIDIGYVFLYFYGLERRLLVDQPSASEEALLVAEVVRLRLIYSGNGSFQGYSQSLLDAVEARTLASDADAVRAFQPDLTRHAGNMPLPLKVVIARKVVAEEPLAFELAAAGLIGLPWDVAPRNPVVMESTRPIYLRLLRERFEAAFPLGFTLRNRRDSHLRLDYRGASAGLGVNLGATQREHLPDPATLTWTKLVAISTQVSSELEPYAKMIAYYPERANSLAALGVCPAELAPSTAAEARTWIDGLSKPIATVRFADLAWNAIGAREVKWTLRHHRMVADALSNVGRGLEPDPADGSERLDDATEVIVIGDPDCLTPKSSRFDVAAAAAVLVAGVARAHDGGAAAVEEAWLEIAPQRLTLSPGEVQRLRARLRWLRGSSAGLAKAKRLLAGASPADREAVAWSTAIAAAAGGLLEKAEVAVLEAIYDKLEVPRRSLYTTIHSATAASATPASEPITVAIDAPGVSHSIPRPPKLAKPGLDEERLRQVRKETERVAAVLADIFVEEEESEPVTTMADQDGAHQFAGLDPAHMAFVKRLITNKSWSRADFEAAAREAGLMPDGSLEVVNEWAFDRFDEPLVEEGETLSVNVSLLESMTEQADVA